MTKEEKIEFADRVISLISNNNNDNSPPKFVGNLNKKWGIKGFKTADTETPVFEQNDRYFIMLESLDGKVSVKIPFYKEDLKKAINFSN